MRYYFSFLLFIGFGVVNCFSQSETPRGWHLLGVEKDSIYGINLNKAYSFLKEKKIKSKPIIVAVLDSGVDTTHEDLKNVLWHNPKEIPNNGVDDDHNGYVDDVYGWNFLGGKDGKNITKNNEEKVRVYHRFKKQFSDKEIDTNTLNSDEKYNYNTYKRAAKELDINPDEAMKLSMLEMAQKALVRHDEILRKEMGVQEFTCSTLEKFEPQTKQGKDSKNAYLTFMKMIGIDGEEKNSATLTELDDFISKKKSTSNAKDSVPEDFRAEIIKDNYTNINDKYYGNKDVMSTTSMHGTHVSGIIAAQRNNGLGMEGVADNVKIMMVRVVPDGDEYDKDIALGIIYAVDNGAKVINMSFGKAFSPEKKWVDSAVKYAAKKDVLIVHAAGNESENIDSNYNFPSPIYFGNTGKASNFITVGASGDSRPGQTDNLSAEFSNYGKESVDLFAPGVRIYSTLPGGNEYGNLKGTSMASPVVAGLASLLRSYFPDFSSKEIKEIIEKSAQHFSDSVLSVRPRTAGDRVSFNQLSKTGGIADAFAAVRLAYTLEVKKTNMKSAPNKSFNH